MLEGSRSLDNYYIFTLVQHTCHNTTTNEVNLWHEKLRHLNFKILKRITSTSVVRGYLRWVNNHQKCVVHVSLVRLENHTQSGTTNFYNKSVGTIAYGSNGSYAS